MNAESPINPSLIEADGLRGGVDDAIIVPLVLATLAVNRLVRLLTSMIVQILDYAFPLAMQLIWLPLLVARIIGDGIAAVLRGCLLYTSPSPRDGLLSRMPSSA